MHELHSFDVVEEVGEIQCVTQRPVFEPVCLNKWCLRLSAAKYKTKKEGDTNEQDLKIGQ